MKGIRIDWSLHGGEIVELYLSGLSVRELIPIIKEKHGVEYPSGTLTNFLGRRGVQRTQSLGHKLGHNKRYVACELCGEPYHRTGYKQLWCQECMGDMDLHKRGNAHGMVGKQLEILLASQDGKCTLCFKPFSECHRVGVPSDLTFYVDHDHETNRVRGLLCPSCNLGLSFVDRPEWLARAIDYVHSDFDARQIDVKKPVAA